MHSKLYMYSKPYIQYCTLGIIVHVCEIPGSPFIERDQSAEQAESTRLESPP